MSRFRRGRGSRVDLVLRHSLLLLCAAAVGCAASPPVPPTAAPRPCPAGTVVRPTAPFQGDEPVVAPGTPAIVELSDADAEALRARRPHAIHPDEFLPLTESQTARRAAERAAGATLLQYERALANTRRTLAGAAAADVVNLQVDVLELQLRAARNRAVGAALRAFYQLVGTEARLDLARRCLAETDQLVERAGLLRQQTGEIPIEEPRLRQAQAEFQALCRGLERQASGLSRQMQDLLELPAEAPMRIWPKANLQVRPVPPDLAVALATARTTRADLLTIALVQRRLTWTALPVARLLLQQEDPVLGLPAITDAPGAPAACDHELCVRREQLALLHERRRRQAEAEVLAAHDERESALDQVAQAHTILDIHREILQRQELAHSAMRGLPFALGQARIAVWEGESALVTAAVAWHIADIHWQQSQGLLGQDEPDSSRGEGLDGRTGHVE